MTAPLVSVIIPAYNQAEYLERALDSIAAQTYEGPVEVLVVDDGSPDDSGDRARRHRLAPRVLHQENAGVAAARNLGISHADGEYLAFLDADDMWHPGKLEAQIRVLEALGRPGLCFTRYQRADPEGAPLAHGLHPEAALTPWPHALAYRNFIACSSVVVSRRALELGGGHFPDGEGLRRAGEDYALWLRVACHATLVYVPRVMMTYTVHPNNRVGADFTRHYEGAMTALASAARWEPGALERLGGRPLWELYLWRSGKLLVDAVRYRDRVGPAPLRRAVRAMHRSWTDVLTSS